MKSADPGITAVSPDIIQHPQIFFKWNFRDSSALLAIKITVRRRAGKSLSSPNTDLFGCVCWRFHGNDQIGGVLAKYPLFSMESARRGKEYVLHW